MRAIKDRILNLAKKFGIQEVKRGGRLAKKLGVSNSVIYRLMDEISLPGLENLTKICRAAQVNADYLLFGQEPQFLYGRPGDEVFYEARAPAPADLDLMADCVSEIVHYLQERRLKISARRLGQVVRKLYEHCITEDEKPGPELVKAYLRLT